MGDKTEELWKLLSIWRSRFSEEDREAGLAALEPEIIKRTDAVVGGSHRSSYVKAAELVVALDEIYAEMKLRRPGETRESIRMIHSRKTAFKAELQALSEGRE